MARQRLGQHFLTQAGILERIAAAACPSREALVLEIGPGRGALTAHLLPRTGRLVAIEKDGALAAGLQAKYPGITVVTGDAREVDLGQWGPAVIAGNLPYYAATPILDRSLDCPAMIRGVFLIQKEVAERLTASPGTRQYGYLSVATQVRAKVELLFGVPPSAFRPPPEVQSAVVRVTPRNLAAGIGAGELAGFLTFAGSCFRHKRKTLRNNLAGVYGKHLTDSLDLSRRAEQLPIEELAWLYHLLLTEAK